VFAVCRIGNGGLCQLLIHKLRCSIAGYFALNVPSGLALYWFVNNILSTGQQAWLKTTYADVPSGSGTSAISAADRAEEERQERVKQLTGEGHGGDCRPQSLIYICHT
jgi:hypothetical protein